MKKIALVMDGWKRFFTYAWPSGILQRIKETGEEVNLYIFNSSGDWSMDDGYNVGEYNIYNLPDFNDFDGIIMDLNNIRYKDVGQRVIDAVKKSGKPAISIANKIDDFYYVGIDNYLAMKEMIAHLYGVHDCRKFWFVMGPADNYESNVRVQALKDFMQELDNPYEENDFYYESFEFGCGYRGFMKLLEDHGDIPEAVICANDNIAVGVCEAAAEMGYQVPDDFCVTGFDNFDKASYYIPRISTIGHIREEVGYRCADILIRIWNGEQVPKFNYTDAEGIFWESCDCESELEIDVRGHAKDQILYELETTRFEEQVLALEYELLNCKTVREMSNLIPKCIPSMRCDAMYLIIDDHMNDFRQRKDYYQQLIDDENFHVQGYPKQMNIEFAYESGKNIDCEGKTIDSLFPMFDYGKGGTDFLFMPLHFRDKTVGFFVIRNAVYLMEKQYLFKVINALTSGMENLHEKEKQNLLIMFVDMDRLKMINDQYGHEYGDIAIKIIANAILKCCTADAIPIRMGGDEFLIVHSAMSKEEENAIVARIRVEIEASAEKKKLPFQLSFSIGCITTDMNLDKSLDDYVREADEIMYIEKVSKKANRTE